MAHWPGGLPALYTQLDTGASTAGKDCGPLACINAIKLASGGHIGPRFQDDMPGTGDDVKGWVHLVRTWAGNLDRPFRIPTDVVEALNHPDLAEIFNRSGLPRLRAQPYNPGSWETLKRNAKRDYPVVLAVNYGVLHDGRAPTGSNTFRGGHVLDIAGCDTRNHLVFVNDGDSLFDGRRGEFPKGYQEARLRDFRKAAGRFGSNPPGDGEAVYIVVRGGRHG